MNVAPAASHTGQVLVGARGLSQRYGAQTVVDRVDLTLRRGGLTTLIGPNGAGKTTLLRLLLGLEKATTGTITRQDGLRVGYVPQRLHVDDSLPLTVRRFLALGGAPSDAVAATLHDVGAAHVRNASLQTISGGELRRVLLARALLRDPDLLVLDEPTAGVDLQGQADLYDLIDSVRRATHCGVLLVSHDLHVVMAATDQVVCLNHHVCCSGAPDAVSEHPEYLALFGPQAARAHAVYTHNHDHDHDASGAVVPLDEGQR